MNKISTKLIMAAGLFSIGMLQSVVAQASTYECTSDSKQFQISLTTGASQDAVTLNSVTIQGDLDLNASLSSATDGTYNNANGPLSFEIFLPYSSEADEGKVHLLSVQIPAISGAGTIEEKYADQDSEPFQILSQETIRCAKTK